MIRFIVPLNCPLSQRRICGIMGEILKNGGTSMPITTVLFDLDGTLLPMDLEIFVKDY